MSRYAAWIASEVPSDGSSLEVLGQCAAWTAKMLVAFPELKVQAGYYYDVHWGPRQHWWLLSPEGKVVDPTAHQFPTKGGGIYEALEEQDRPVGKCMDCGSDTFRVDPATGKSNPSAPTFCNEACERAAVAYLTGGVSW